MSYVKAMLTAAREKFDANAEEWGLGHRHASTITLFPIVLVGAVAVLGALALLMRNPFRPLFHWVTVEDSVLEWPQFLLVFIASLIFAWIGAQLIGRGERRIGLLYLVIALGALFVAGEEISWGQRIFGWGTPETLSAINHQDETNVHNIGWVQRAFHIVVLFGGLYGWLVPLLRATLWARWEHSELGFLLIPPLCLVPAFLMPFGYRFFRLVFWPNPNNMVVTFGEAPELCLYFGLLVFAWLNMRRLSKRYPARVASISPAS